MRRHASRRSIHVLRLLPDDGQAGRLSAVHQIRTEKRACGKFQDGFYRTDESNVLNEPGLQNQALNN